MSTLSSSTVYDYSSSTNIGQQPSASAQQLSSTIQPSASYHQQPLWSSATTQQPWSSSGTQQQPWSSSGTQQQQPWSSTAGYSQQWGSSSMTGHQPCGSYQPCSSQPVCPLPTQPCGTSVCPPPPSQPCGTSVCPPPPSQPCGTSVCPPPSSQPCGTSVCPPSQPIPQPCQPQPVPQPIPVPCPSQPVCPQPYPSQPCPPQPSTTSFPATDAIISSTHPIDIQETETATICGQTGIVANRQDLINWRGTIPISSYPINEDACPQIIHKKSDQVIKYCQEIAVRYLRPPTPPRPGDIIIREDNAMSVPPAPPLVIRQQPPRPVTPEVLVIREAPPKPLPPIGQKIISISGKRMPPPPRKVIIERLPPIPSAPQSIMIERWLAYEQQKRRVIFQRAQQPGIYAKEHNLIIQWEAPGVEIHKELRDLGVIRANPAEYVDKYGSTLINYYSLPDYVKDIQPPSGLVLASSCIIHKPALEGDVYALGLVDLDCEGLSEYKEIAAQYAQWVFKYLYAQGQSTEDIQQLYNSVIGEVLAQIQRSPDGTLSIAEVRKILDLFNQKLCRTLCPEQTDRFVKLLDRNSDGRINYNEFCRAMEATCC